MQKPLLWWIVFLLLLSAVAFGIYAYRNNGADTTIRIKEKEYSLTWNTLNFDSLWVSDDEIEKIGTKIRWFPLLETLYLWWNHITGKGLMYLAWLPDTNIRIIDLSNNKTGDAWMQEFLEKSSFKVVDISGNAVTDLSTRNIGNNQKISYLTINNNAITDSGFQNIVENRYIEYLSIENNLLTDAAIDYISKNINTMKIRYLKLKGNKFSSEGLKKLDGLKAKKVFQTLEY